MSIKIIDRPLWYDLSAKKILEDRLDFSASIKTEFTEEIPRNYTVLLPDRLRNSASSFGSPSTSSNDHDQLTSRGSSLCSTSSSPISITAELTNVASPLTPLTQNNSPRVDVSSTGKVSFLAEKSQSPSLRKTKSPSPLQQVVPVVEISPPDEEAEAEEIQRPETEAEERPSSRKEKKHKKEKRRHSSHSRSPSGKRRREESSCSPTKIERLDTDDASPDRISPSKEFSLVRRSSTSEADYDVGAKGVFKAAAFATPESKLVKENGISSKDEESRKIEPFRIRIIPSEKPKVSQTTIFTPSPLKPKKLTININGETTPVNKKPLVDIEYGSDAADSDEEDEEEPTPGTSYSNTLMKPRVIGPAMPSREELEKLRAEKMKRSAGSESPVCKRKRLLSERGEKELNYPIMDRSTISIWNWKNCDAIRGRSRGCGLVNPSNDCFLNVILQIVTHTAPLARYILEKHPDEECTRPIGQCLSCAMRQNHLKKCFTSPMAFRPGWIRPFLARIFPSHIPGSQEDAHELLSLMLDAFDPPMTSSKNNNNGALPSGISSSSKPSTPIEQIFGGTLRNQITCNICRTPYINYERIRELNLAIRKRPDGDQIRMAHLTDIYFRDENVSNFDCKKCARKTVATRQTRILRPPATLLVQLKRFNAFGGKIRLPVTADIDVDLTRHMYNGESSQYALTGIVEHIGMGLDFGHYVSYVRGFDQQTWYYFDDESVSQVPVNKVVSTSNPYILVYSRREDLGLPPKKLNGLIHNNIQNHNGGNSSSGFGQALNNGNGIKLNNGHPKLLQNNYRYNNGNLNQRPQLYNGKFNSQYQKSYQLNRPKPI